MDLLTLLLSIVPSYFLRRYYTEKKLADKIEVTISDDRRGLYINGSDIPYAELNLKITNLTPFEVTIERLWCDVRFIGGSIANLESTLWHRIPARSSKHINLRSTMTAPQRGFIARLSAVELGKHQADRQFRIGLEGELSTRVRRVQLFGRELTTTNVETVNFHLHATGNSS